MKSRQVVAAKIIGNPGAYCVCEGCGSIITNPPTRACPSCNGYRFDASVGRVVGQATLLATRPPESVTGEDLK
jgi:hypothetical protein